METIASLPFARLSTDKAGLLAAGSSFAVPPGVTDLIVISHGWKNSEQAALELYGTLLSHVRDVAGESFTQGARRWGVAGVFWPAFRFRPDLTLLPEDGSAGVGGPAASVGDVDLSRDELALAAAAVAAALECDETPFVRAAIDAAAGGALANAFLDRLRKDLTPAADLAADHADLLMQPGGELIANLSSGGQGASLSFVSATADPAVGNAAGFREVVGKFQRWKAGRRAAVAGLLNQATYYEMKARAGQVGKALAPIIQTSAANVRVHLIGHSFGARLVSSLANTLTAMRPASLSLLQGAFSHNGFGIVEATASGPARIEGVFRAVVAEKRIAGPLLVTHTHNDTAVGFFYALASTLSQDIASGMQETASRLIGGPDDRHGGLGANGALSLASSESEDHVALPAAPTPILAPGIVHNVLADAIIRDHNDVANREVARLVWAALT